MSYTNPWHVITDKIYYSTKIVTDIWLFIYRVDPFNTGLTTAKNEKIGRREKKRKKNAYLK